LYRESYGFWSELCSKGNPGNDKYVYLTNNSHDIHELFPFFFINDEQIHQSINQQIPIFNLSKQIYDTFI